MICQSALLKRDKKRSAYQAVVRVLICCTLAFSYSAQGRDLQQGGRADAAATTVERRGIVLYPAIWYHGAQEWVNLMVQSGVNLLGIHADSNFETLSKLKAYLQSEQGRLLLTECTRHSIDVEYEVHALQHLLPRELFDQHPEYFRMDKDGNRQRQFNMSFTEEGAYREIEKRIIEITQWMKPTTHRYFFLDR